MHSNRHFFVVAIVCLCHASPLAAQGDIQFNRDIRPILSQNCFYCHGLDQNHREAGLRLDTRDAAIEDLGGYQAIVPGNASESELLVRILSDDPDTLMPPPESERTITPAQRELIARWIDQGAEYQDHWAWQNLELPKVPGTIKSQTIEGAAAIDAFLQQRWADEDVKPVSPASAREQMRRLSFDLRGLPPTLKEVTDFQADPSQSHYAEIRDRWMNELAYAEHQAVRWLDLVRWADTSGFVSDEPIASGAYRAWIIKAYANNMPFDQFSRMQLAGDLIENPTDDSLVASGYNRIVNTNCEAGAIEEEQLYKLKGEHVRAVGTVWMGLTTGCAECHDHKFDPISAKDYYSLAAFWDDLVEAGVYTPGDRRVPLHYVHDDSADSARDAVLTAEISAFKSQIIGDISAADAEVLQWEQETIAKLKDKETRVDFAWIPAQLPGPRVVEGEFDSIKIDDTFARETRADANSFYRHHASDLMTGYIYERSQKTDAEKDAWFVDVWIDRDDRPQMLGIQVSHGDYGRLGWKTANYETYLWGEDTSGTLVQSHSWSDPERVKRIGDLPSESGWVRLRVPSSQWISPVGGQSFEATGMAWLQTGGHVRWADSGMELRTDKATALQLGETAIRKWYETPWNRQVYQSRLEYVSKALLTKSDQRSDLQREIVREAFCEQSHPELLDRLRSLESELYVRRSQAMPVLVSRSSSQRKTTRLLGRGDFSDKTGPLVESAVPEFLGAIEADAGVANRLHLANWLFDQGASLTARVYVNRLWHQFYGRGLSETLEDSGTQGDWPSHLDLLNWLAVEFRDSGWNRDHMVRLLTSTTAYRLSSVPQSSDPGNRLHARQGRFRLPAEAIRDSALTAAGLLMQTSDIPLESFYPYQPLNYWERSSKVMFGSRHLDWNTSRTASQYHRSMYTFWKRQNIHPTMLAFDAPTRQECTAKRNITNTPGQALALLNDPMFVEAARVMAIRIMQTDASSDQERIDSAYRFALQRKPSARETTTLLSLLDQQRELFGRQTDAAVSLISIGQSPTPDDIDACELAAWTVLARTLLNLHEFLNRS
ncbi:PSD1 and planctomycete cytochrome C domain-containing protein [Planctomycetes bacterium K23_9]|uniref:Planctomycete cytochrome C n=1 Tax=Stieleria marina TaxID=1930275 RepID=A0A517NSL0_9BACT|nr:Planctomycete cytochrome C [Planctomycetes bacterium K23_9]